MHEKCKKTLNKNLQTPGQIDDVHERLMQVLYKSYTNSFWSIVTGIYYSLFYQSSIKLFVVVYVRSTSLERHNDNTDGTHGNCDCLIAQFLQFINNLIQLC